MTFWMATWHLPPNSETRPLPHSKAVQETLSEQPGRGAMTRPGPGRPRSSRKDACDLDCFPDLSPSAPLQCLFTQVLRENTNFSENS